MSKTLNKIFLGGAHLLLKLKRLIQSISIGKHNKNYSDAVLILSQNNRNCEATCIRKKQSKKMELST